MDARKGSQQSSGALPLIPPNGRDEPRRGSQVPSHSVILPYADSLGDEAAELYGETGRTAQEWQRALLTSIMGRNADGLWTHTKFGYAVPRRNGKNEVVAMRELWGLQHDEHILHTAHRTTTSRSAWERLCSLLDDCGIAYKASGALGQETVRIKDGGRCQFRTRTTKGGLGEGFDLLIIDEAQEYTTDQEAALKYVVSDSQNPQTIFCGTPPTPDSSGTVFMALRDAAFGGTAVDTGFAEWSVETQCDPHDRDAWYQTNPSLGTILTERKILAEIGADALDFNIQRLGYWVRYNLKSAISAAEWEEAQLTALPALAGKLYAGIKFGQDGRNAALSIAVKTADNRIFVESIDIRPVRAGVDWILSFLASADLGGVACDGGSAGNMATHMKEAGLKPPTLPKLADIVTAHAAFEEDLFGHRLCHMGQPGLAESATNCEKRAIGTNGGFGYRSIKEGVDVALLDSVVLASWLCREKGRKKTRQQITY